MCGGGRRRRRSRPGIQNQKQEPHTKLWGIIFGMRCWWFLLRFFVCLCFFLLGMLHLGYACLISSSCGGMERVQTQFFMTESAGTAQGVDVALPWGHGAYANPISTKLGPYFAELVCRACGTVLPPSASFWPDVGRFWGTLQNVRLHVGLCRPHLRPCWADVGHAGQCWASVGTALRLSWAILGRVGAKTPGPGSCPRLPREFYLFPPW